MSSGAVGLRRATSLLSLACCAAFAACEDAPAAPAATASAPPPMRPVPSYIAPPLPTAPPSVASASQGPPRSAPTGAACAPSLAYAGAIDARTSAALARCQRLRTGQGRLSLRCGEEGRSLADPARVVAAVPQLGPGVVDRIRGVARRGRELGRNTRAFGIVGDSISVAYEFLTPFSGRRKLGALGELAERELTLPDGGTVIDWFRGAAVDEKGGAPVDAFEAFRAAEVGARAAYAVDDGKFGPLRELERRVNPAIVVVTFGANDAASRPAPPEELADEMEASLLRIIEHLEARGMVVILSNEMRHGDQPGRKECPSDDPTASDWRVAVAQNATSARTAEVACREELPLIDLRHALDASTNHGLGPDAVHLSAHRGGAGLLTNDGLDCGYNVRNLATLLALRRVLPIVREVYDSSSQ